MVGTLIVIAILTLAVSMAIGLLIFWSQYRVPGRKAILRELTGTAATAQAWAKGPKGWSASDAKLLCDRLRREVSAGTEANRERLCRRILERVAQRSNAADDWALFGESAEAAAAIEDEAGHWRIAEMAWGRAAKAAVQEQEKSAFRQKKAHAAEVAADLERRDDVHIPV